MRLWIILVVGLLASRGTSGTDGTTLYLPLIAGGSPPPEAPVVLVGAGDIASCESSGDEATALLLDDIEGTVVTLGDNAYISPGVASPFDDCYGPTWGRHLARTFPSVGNHEYTMDGAARYFSYFGEAAGEPGKGYYSYDVGAWHVVVLNSNCDQVEGGCGTGSPQEQWLREDLAASTATCTLAYWHHPRRASGGSYTNVQPFWRALADHDAEIVLAGHRHYYERFTPLDGNGAPDAQGIRQFVVGTGGRSLEPLDEQNLLPTSRAQSGDSYGVLKLSLYQDRYEWEFVPVAGSSYTDTGSGECH